MNVKKFLICPTYVMGKNYLRFKGRRYTDWIILAVDTDLDVIGKIRGRRDYEAEKIVTTEYAKQSRLEELEADMAYLNITITPVSY